MFYQNDDAGKDVLRGVKEVLAAAGKKLISEESHEVSDPTVDSQIVSMHASGADVLVAWGSPKATLQSLRKTHDIGWRPAIYINPSASSVPAVLTPVGLDRKSTRLNSSHLVISDAGVC